MKTVRAGIIGIGNIGFTHAVSIFSGAVEGMTLCGICDIDPARKAVAAERFPGVPFFTDHEALLSQEDIDAVIIAVPHPLHAAIAERAFAHGKHVLLEKPMDITVSRGRALMAAAEKSGKLFAIMFNQRTGNLFAEARRIVRGGELGALKRSVWIVTNWYRTQAYYDSGTWRATWSGEGGGVLMNQAPHQLDLWQWICGMPESITAFCDEAKFHDIQVEDNATIFARFPGGADGVFITSTGEYPGTNRLEISGTKGKLVLENGLLKWWKLPSDERVLCATEQGSSLKLSCEYEELRQETGVSGHRKILANFAAAISRGEPLIAPGCEGINELTIQNAAYLSAWEGNIPVRLPFDEKRYDALLAKKQAASAAPSCASVHSPNEEYSDRWQINW